MSASKAPVFRAAMSALIKTALAGQTEVGITFGSVPASEPDDMVFIKRVISRKDFASIGAGTLKEFLDLDVVINCFRGGDDIVAATGQSTQQVASERAWALLALIETRVRTDITLGLAQPFWVLTSRTDEVETNPDEEIAGRYSELTATFTAETRI